jgi:hypothetical protein
MPSAKKKYGRFTVERERESGRGLGSTDVWYVRRSGKDWEVDCGTKKNGKKLARTLAAALDAADVLDPTDVLPPEWGPRGITADSDWEAWADESKAVPVAIASAGNAAVAAWLKVVHKEREKWIANTLGVSESTVRQYLSDLREGRR